MLRFFRFGTQSEIPSVQSQGSVLSTQPEDKAEAEAKEVDDGFIEVSLPGLVCDKSPASAAVISQPTDSLVSAPDTSAIPTLPIVTAASVTLDTSETKQIAGDTSGSMPTKPTYRAVLEERLPQKKVITL